MVPLKVKGNRFMLYCAWVLPVAPPLPVAVMVVPACGTMNHCITAVVLVVLIMVPWVGGTAQLKVVMLASVLLAV